LGNRNKINSNVDDRTRIAYIKDKYQNKLFCGKLTVTEEPRKIKIIKKVKKTTTKEETEIIEEIKDMKLESKSMIDFEDEEFQISEKKEKIEKEIVKQEPKKEPKREIKKETIKKELKVEVKKVTIKEDRDPLDFIFDDFEEDFVEKKTKPKKTVEKKETINNTTSMIDFDFDYDKKENKEKKKNLMDLSPSEDKKIENIMSFFDDNKKGNTTYLSVNQKQKVEGMNFGNKNNIVKMKNETNVKVVQNNGYQNNSYQNNSYQNDNSSNYNQKYSNNGPYSNKYY
jgi:hypothetical protein